MPSAQSPDSRTRCTSESNFTQLQVWMWEMMWMQKGIMCSVVCGQCRGIGCSNSAQPDESDRELDAH